LQNAHSREAYEIAVTPPLMRSTACADSLHKPLKMRRRGGGDGAPLRASPFKMLIFLG
jgi:hypothetical protein